MSEQDETAPVVDEAPVAEDAAPGEAEAPASPPEGYVEEKRLQDARNELNRQLALRDRARQGDNDALRELIGAEFAQAEEDPDSEEDDDDVPRDPRVDALLQEREAERAQREQEEGWNRFNADLDKLAKGKNLSQRDRFLIYTDTLQAGGDPDALSNAYGEFTKERDAYDKAVVQAYIDSKRAPYVPPGGAGATEVTDPLDGKARRERLAARLDANAGDF